MRMRKVVVDGHVYPTAMDAWRAEAHPDLNYTTFMERLYAGWEAWRALRVKPQHQEGKSNVCKDVEETEEPVCI